eukprot:gene27986-33795_t
MPWGKKYACPSPTKPVVDIIAQSYYIDGAKSIVHPELFQKNRAEIAPLLHFIGFVDNSSVHYLCSNPPFLPAAECTLQWLNHWAEGGAMLGKVNKQGDDHRGWCVSSLMTSFLLIRDEPRLNQTSVKVVSKWLTAVASSRIDFYLRSGHVWNNHLTWVAFITLQSSAVSNNRTLFDEGIKRVLYTISTIQANGSLPYELKRHERAAHYVDFSLTALMPLAEFAMANGVDLYKDNDGALHRLVNLAIEVIRDPSIIQRATGYAQERFGKEDYTWLEIYNARFNDARAVPYLRAFRPMWSLYTGQTTKIWGKPLPGKNTIYD